MWGSVSWFNYSLFSLLILSLEGLIFSLPFQKVMYLHRSCLYALAPHWHIYSPRDISTGLILMCQHSYTIVPSSSSIDIDVTGKGFAAVVNIYNHWTLSEADYSQQWEWAFLNQVKTLRGKIEVSGGGKNSASRRYHRNPARASSLPTLWISDSRQYP